jgi:hypothetical protein
MTRQQLRQGEQILLQKTDMRRNQLLIMFGASSLLGSMFLGCHPWQLLGCYPWQKSFLQVNSSTNHPEPESLPAPTPAAENLELTPEQIEPLSEQLADELAKPEPPKEKLCSGNSDAYLKLPLKTVDPAFRPCAAELLKLTQVPLILPPNASKTSNGERLYAFFYTPFTNANQYSLGLTWTPDAFSQYHGQSASFYGEKLTAKSPTLAAYFKKRSAGIRFSPFYQSYQKELGSVSLSHGITGYYIPAVCGVNCHAAYGLVLWDQGGYRYEIGIKMGKKAAVLKIVNAAIENQRYKKLNVSRQN